MAAVMPREGEDPVFDKLVSLNYLGPDATGGELEAHRQSLWNDYVRNIDNERSAWANAQRDGKQMFGSRGIVTTVFPATKAGDIAQVSALPGQNDAYEALQAKHPGYAQIGDRALGPKAGTDTNISSYILDPGSVIYDPEYGYIAPVQQFGQGGKKGQSYMQRGGAQMLAVMAPAVGGILASGLSGAGTLSGSGGAEALAGGGADVMTSGGALIPDYTMGIGANAGNFGAGIIPGGIAAPSVAASGAGAGIGIMDAVRGGGTILDTATKWMKDNPIATMVGGRALSAAFTPNAIDVQDNRFENQQQLEQTRRNAVAANTAVAPVKLGIMPSGAPLRDLQGRLVYPTRT